MPAGQRSVEAGDAEAKGYQRGRPGKPARHCDRARQIGAVMQVRAAFSAHATSANQLCGTAGNGIQRVAQR